MKGIIKDALILFVITLVAGCLLAVVNELTKAPIEKTNTDKRQEACKAVFEAAASFELVDDLSGESAADGKIVFDQVYLAKASDNSLLGYVILVSTKEGFGGNISFALGITTNRHLNGISIMSSSETPDLGLEADKVLVPQFADKDVTEFTYTKTGSTAPSEIDAISSATITTKAFVHAVNETLAFYDNRLAKGGAY